MKVLGAEQRSVPITYRAYCIRQCL